MKKYEEMYF